MFVNGERYPKKPSIWANPYKVGKDGSISDVLAKFENHIREKLVQDENTFRLSDLRGRNLGCWCVPSTVNLDSNSPFVCHGQVLLHLMNE